MDAVVSSWKKGNVLAVGNVWNRTYFVSEGPHLQRPCHTCRESKNRDWSAIFARVHGKDNFTPSETKNLMKHCTNTSAVMACAAAYLVNQLVPELQILLEPYLNQVGNMTMIAIHHRQGDKSISSHLTEAERVALPQRSYSLENDDRDSLDSAKLKSCIDRITSRQNSSNVVYFLASDTSKGRQSIQSVLGKKVKIIAQLDEPRHIGIVNQLQTSTGDALHSAMVSTIIDWYLFAMADIQIRLSDSTFSMSASLLGNNELVPC
jgi:hypothetical protein